jgi:hypothetical protein
MTFFALSHDVADLRASLRRELTLLVGAVAFGVLVVPPLLWLVGERALGPYPGGGVGAIVANFFRGLVTGSWGFWVVALAPYLFITILRALVAIARASPAQG